MVEHPIRKIIVESIKTTSMKNVSTEVLDENKERYSRCKEKAEKSYDVLRHIQLHMSKHKKIRCTVINFSTCGA